MSKYTDFTTVSASETSVKPETEKKEKKNQITPVTVDPSSRAKLLEQKKKLHKIRKIQEWGLFTGYLTPSLVGVMLFFFLPLLMLLKTSFQKSSTNTDFIGFANYERVLTNEAFKSASLNTLTFAGLAVPLAVLLALLLALLLNSGLPGNQSSAYNMQ